MKKKLRNIFIISFIFLIITVLYIKIPLIKDSAYKTLLKSLNESGASIVSSEVSLRGKINSNKLKSVSSLKELVSNVVKDMGIAGSDSSINIIKNDNIEGVEFNKASSSSCNIAISAVNSKLTGDKEESYITVSIVDSADEPRLDENSDIVRKSLGKYGIKPQITSCITGNYDGKLENKQLNDICKNIFKKTDANKVEGIRENNLISVSAYSPAISESVNVNGNRINLNFAVRYNSYENKTYIWLATPIITTEY